MPIYQYICDACHESFEELIRSPEPDRVRCPACGSEEVERQWSVFSTRQGNAGSPALPIGGCGRCGDPNGPCSI